MYKGKLYLSTKVISKTKDAQDRPVGNLFTYRASKSKLEIKLYYHKSFFISITCKEQKLYTEYQSRKNKKTKNITTEKCFATKDPSHCRFHSNKPNVTII